MTGNDRLDRWPDFRHFAADVAMQLGKRRGESWTVVKWYEGNVHPAATLAPLDGCGPDHGRIHMQYGFAAAEKVTVTGLWPNDSSVGAPSRSVNPQRGAGAVAQAIDTYVLRGCLRDSTASYLDALPGVVAGWKAAQARSRHRDDIMARFAALVEADPPGPGQTTLNLSALLPDRRGEVKVTLDDPPAVSLELHGLDVDTALALVERFAASGPARGRCCAVFGAGHDPRLARLGCRRATERQEKPTWDEGSALYDLYRRSGTAQTWEDWLGPDAAAIHEAWR